MFIDLHHHLVHGVDDGAQDFEAAGRLLLRAGQDGIRHLIATPHMVPGQEEFPMEKYLSHLEMARAFCREKGLDLQLYSGAEILYTRDTPRLLQEGKALTLAGSPFVLVEFSPDDAFAHLREAAQRISGAGFIPVFAHIERYACLQKWQHVLELKQQFSVRCQVNGRTVIHRQGFFRRRQMDRLLENGLVDYIATDAHDMPGRGACMTQAFEALSQVWGEEYARRLTCLNALEILPGAAGERKTEENQ